MEVAATFATGLHQVDNPVIDRDGNLYVTYSGTRGQEVPVSIFRVRPNGTRETFSSGIVNPTSMAISPDGQLYVSSRFEGTVYRLADGRDGGAVCERPRRGVRAGVRRGRHVVRRRSVRHHLQGRPGGQADAFATLPSSVAAFHLALAPDGRCTSPRRRLSSYDHVYRIDLDGPCHADTRASAGRKGWRSTPPACCS